MILGITGTRKGATSEQLEIVERHMWEAEVLHHGDCVGVDEQAHRIAQGLDVPIRIHPPRNGKSRAFCKGAEKTYTPVNFIERNHRIVDCCTYLLVVPDSYQERTRSGTWATKRYAQSVGRAYLIVYPDGSTEGNERT